MKLEKREYKSSDAIVFHLYKERTVRTDFLLHLF